MEVIFTNGYAREEETKKGMDGSQITGASSVMPENIQQMACLILMTQKDSDNTNKGEPKIEPNKAKTFNLKIK